MQTVRVRLRKPSRVFTFLCKNVLVERDMHCVVRSDRGLEYGTCVASPEPCSEEMAKRIDMQVIRKATENDLGTFEQLLRDEAKARSICAAKIEEKDLPMKLVDVEYMFDRHKVIFYFTAEQRVDFRELVRDLAHALRARIELRHIQVRDQAKMIGGIGECGRLLCCRTWLREFMPISMKMAKRQNLSLSPEKISGQCGRLMCCLGFENEQYEDEKKARTQPALETDAEEPTVVGPSDGNGLKSEAEPERLAERAAVAPVTAQEQEGAQPAKKSSRRKSRRRRKKRRRKSAQGGTGGETGGVG